MNALSFAARLTLAIYGMLSVMAGVRLGRLVEQISQREGK